MTFEIPENWNAPNKLPPEGLPVVAMYYPWNHAAYPPSKHVVWFYERAWRMAYDAEGEAFVLCWQHLPAPAAKRDYDILLNKFKAGIAGIEIGAPDLITQIADACIQTIRNEDSYQEHQRELHVINTMKDARDADSALEKAGRHGK